MSDGFLSSLKEPPRPAFAAALRSRLDVVEAEQDAPRVPGAWLRLRPVLAGLCLVAAAGGAFSFPAVRASAREFLEVFRVRRFAAVPVDVDRLARLRDREIDLRALLGGQVETLEDPGQPEAVADAGVAADLAGIRVALPSRLPQGCTFSGVRVGRRGAFRAVFDAGRLELLAEALDVPEPDIPHDLDGATFTVTTPPVVSILYARNTDHFQLLQARAPEVELPPGVELARLGAMGLRLAGLSPEEAQAFSRKIDWRTTLLVPVPAAGGGFRDVEVGDSQGLLVSSREPRASADGSQKPGPWRSVLLWSKDGKVFALAGPGRGFELLDMADSID